MSSEQLADLDKKVDEHNKLFKKMEDSLRPGWFQFLMILHIGLLVIGLVLYVCVQLFRK